MLRTSTPSFGTYRKPWTHRDDNVYALCPCDLSAYLCVHRYVYQLPVAEFAARKKTWTMETTVCISQLISRSIIYVAYSNTSHFIYDGRLASKLAFATIGQRERIHKATPIRLHRMDSVLQRHICHFNESGRVLRSSLDRSCLPRLGNRQVKNELSYAIFAHPRIPSIRRMVKIPPQEPYHAR